MTEHVNVTGRKSSKKLGFRRHAFVSHPLLLLLPYREGLPDYLTELEKFANVVLDEKQCLNDRINAAVEAQTLASNNKLLREKKNVLIKDLFDVIQESQPSLRVAELLLRLELESVGYSIIESDISERKYFAARLEKDDGQTSTRRNTYEKAIEQVSLVIDNLERMSEEDISDLSAHDCVSGILMLWLYVQYAFENPTDKNSMFNANSYLITTGKNIWIALLKGINESMRDDLYHFDERYGSAAFNQIRNRIGSINQGHVEPFTFARNGKSINSNLNSIEIVQLPENRNFLTVINDQIPKAGSTDDQETIKQYSLLQLPLPIAIMPSVDWLVERETRLLHEFPWATRVIYGIFEDLIARRYCGVTEIGIRPVLILGPAGVGKTRLARRIAEELGLPFMPLGLAGMDDSRLITGTARGWASGQPSPIVEVLLRNKTASALILLDEIEKITHRSSNSAPTSSVLLSLLEHESVSRWFDTFLQVKCDLSRLTFIATANTLRGISSPLISRLVIMEIARPSPEQLLLAIPHVVSDIASQWRVPKEIFPEVRATDLEGIPIQMRDVRVLVQDFLRQWIHKNLRNDQLH